MGIRLSYSQLRDLIECPHRYELQYVLKKKQRIDNRRLLIANVADRALTSWIKSGFKEDYIVPKALEKFDEFVTNNFVPWKNATDRPILRETLENLIGILEHQMQFHGLCTSDAAGQVKLEYVINDVTLVGKPDVYYNINGMILDLKVTKDARWLDWKQLVYYWIIATKQFKKPHGKIGFLSPLMSDTVQIREITQEDKENCVKQIEAAVSNIQNSYYPLTPDEKKYCFMCYMKDSCERFAKVPVTWIRKGKGSL